MAVIGSPTSFWNFVATVRFGTGSPKYLYSCLAPCNLPANWLGDVERFRLAEGCTLEIHESTQPLDKIQALLTSLESGRADFSNLLKEQLVSSVLGVQTSIETAMGHSAVETKRWVFDERTWEAFEHDTESLQAALKRMAEVSGLRFDGDAVKRLGTLELFNLHSWFDDKVPFAVECEGHGESNIGIGLWICRTKSMASVEHMAHVLGSRRGTVFLQKLVRLPAGELRCFIPSDYPPVQTHLSLFQSTQEGYECIASEEYTFIESIRLTMGVLSDQNVIQDKLAKTAVEQGLPKSKAMNVGGAIFMVNEIGPKISEIQKRLDSLDRFITELVVPSETDKWFPKGVDSQLDAIAFLNKELSRGDVKRAILADPYFGHDTFERFIGRLTSKGLHLTILTSWASTHPSTGDPLPDAIAELRKALASFSSQVHPTVRVINVVRGTNQAFHDRYLMIDVEKAAPRVWMLSNSLNKLAGDWPACAVLLSPHTGNIIKRYLEALCDGRDITSDASTTMNFRWP